ncbi:carbamoyl-phosphate synthase (glutamine-hydrolyzing) small subunit [Candidatus Shapirobacteria bacterium CG_4_8_14_3_um_filter_39_11]|uniref:Carbamoyl phosphate synthase small chain n=1 Tax=Candidatus Shapirobacteria bacterium CG_4_8_14_3_um_filter_39_11 TaxID=1974875 RepID=A0A2M8GFZ3_9BACT|nr:MAG: carbamoyl-phosphate synthase (glutamine-hydrolyzing) small subunit [Candidatus Shapirobacteria bacterium CG_4_8_14_3_um_filter_39_11]
MKTRLILEDNSVWEGESFGRQVSTAGEVVFTTAMIGYVEALTDPSYKGQILVFTYPLIGNYGVVDRRFFQSDKIQVSGVIVTQVCLSPSHWQSQKSLDLWLKENNVPGLQGIDTRALTQKLRNKGTMLGKIQNNDEEISFYDPNKENLIPKVSLKKPKDFQSGGEKRVCLIDCGHKRSILNCLLDRNLSVKIVPWNYDPFGRFDFDGMVVSNGQGDPKMAVKTVKIVKQAMEKKLPVLGICLGSQIISLAAGAQTYKLKFGHRSLNQPVKDVQSGRCFITSQNHGFAIDPGSLPSGFKQWFFNLNDQTCEGVISDDGKVAGVQFHPEGSPGPTDTSWVFDEFVKLL